MGVKAEAFKSLYAYVQLIRAGVTTAMPITSVIYKKAAETYEEIAAAAEHAGNLGLRVYLGPSYLSQKHVLSEDETHTVCLPLPEEEAEEGLQNAERFIKNYHNAFDGLIQAAVVPERLELQTEGSILRSKALARKYNLSFRMHAAQGAMDYGYCMRTYGKSSIAYLDSLGVLDEKTLIPHCIYTSGTHNVSDAGNDDQEILARTGTTVIHCPLVYARGGQYLDSFARFLRLGVRMSMGSDTFPTDPFMNIRSGQLMAEISEPGSPWNHSRHFYHAYTVGGADALQRPDLGRLMVGAKADLLFVDVDAPEIGVMDDPLRTLTLACTSSQIKHSVINGRTVMWNRELPGIDEQALREQASRWYAKMKHSYWTRSTVRDSVREDELWTRSLDWV